MSRRNLPRLESPAPETSSPRRWIRPASGALALTLALAGALGAWAATPPAARTVQLQRRLAQLPLQFEANRGQTAPAARFLARSGGAVVFLTAHGAVIKTRPAAVAMNFAQADPGTPRGVAPSPTAVTYLDGHSALHVPAFGRVRYAHLYPGVDLVYYGRQSRLEYDLDLAPGADAARIAMSFTGAAPRLTPAGDLSLGKAMTLRRPVAYQVIDGQRHAVAVRYRLNHAHTVGFALGTYDHAHRLVIDPVLVFATYLGGSGFDNANAVAVDSSGYAYVAGYTQSSDFPTVGAYQSAYNAGNSDAFVAKLATDGTSLVYSTYLGGTLDDRATGIAVDSAGDAFVTGFTDSTDFPTTAGVLQSALAGGVNYDAFVSELNPAGAALVYSTYLGGTQDDKASGIAINSSGIAFVAGSTSSTDFPVTAGAPQAALAGVKDGFIAALNTGGTGLAYATHLGGHALVNSTDNGVTTINGIAVDQTSNVYVGGSTNATSGFPATPGAFQTTNGGGFDGFVAKLSAAGRSFDYVSYLGGTQADAVTAVAVDASGQAFVTGYTSSTQIFPFATFQDHLAGHQNAFVAEFKPDGSGLQYASYLGGSNSDAGSGIAVDSKDVAYIVGSTSSTQDFPLKAPLQATSGGNYDAFFSKVSSDGTQLLFSTFLGGASNDYATGVGIDTAGDVYVAGNTQSQNFPVTSGVLQTAATSTNNAFVAKFVAAAQGAFSPTILGFPAQAATVASAAEAVVFSNQGELPLTISGIAVTGPFSQTNTCPTGTALQPQDSCTISVVFTPTDAGSQTGTLTVTDNAPGGSQTMQLEGNGGDFSLAVNPASNTISAGSSAAYSITLTPAAGYTQVVSLTCTGNPLPANSTCVASPTSLTMNGSTASTATVTITTTVRPAIVPPPVLPKGPLGWLALLGLALAALTAVYAAFRHAGRRRLGWIGTAILLGWAVAAVGCGGSTTNPGTAAGNYTLTMTGKAGNTTHTATAQLTVN